MHCIQSFLTSKRQLGKPQRFPRELFEWLFFASTLRAAVDKAGQRPQAAEHEARFAVSLLQYKQLSVRLVWARWARAAPWRESQSLRQDWACEAPVSQWAGYEAPSQPPHSAERDLGKGKPEESDLVPAAINYSTKHSINLHVLTQTNAERGSCK